MANLRQLIQLAGLIKDEALRRKVIDFLDNPGLSHEDFKNIQKRKIEEAVSPIVYTSFNK